MAAFWQLSAGLSAILGAFIAGISMEGIELHISRRFTEGADNLRILIWRRVLCFTWSTS